MKIGIFALPIFSALLWVNASPALAEQISPSNSDMQFVQHAFREGKLEAELGEIAFSRAGTEGVRKFGKRMVTDHGAANEKLDDLARSKGIKVPTDINDDGKAKKVALLGTPTETFDLNYVDMMIEDHESDVADFEYQSQHAADEDIRAFAIETLPTLKSHLKDIRNLKSQITRMNVGSIWSRRNNSFVAPSLEREYHQ